MGKIALSNYAPFFSEYVAEFVKLAALRWSARMEPSTTSGTSSMRAFRHPRGCVAVAA